MAIEKIRQVAGRALPLRGDNIDTDRIIPARFLKSITFEGLERHLFEDDRQQLEADGRTLHPVSNPAYAGASLLLVPSFVRPCKTIASNVFGVMRLSLRLIKGVS